jgi:RNA polymerase sigma-70 factor (ECF subfamily)
MLQQDIKELVNQSIQGNEHAFRKLVETHQAMIYSLAFRMLCDEDEAKDIVQETFIKVWKHLSRYDTDLKFSTWLFTISSNLCYDRLRVLKRKKVFRSIDKVDLNQFDFKSSENIESCVINSELAKIIAGLTGELTPKQKLVFTLRDLEGLEVTEIKSITGLTTGKIKSNIYLARQFIRKKLENM